MKQGPMRGTKYEVKVIPGTDAEAVMQFERWLTVTGRARYVDWDTVKVIRRDEGTYVQAYVK